MARLGCKHPDCHQNGSGSADMQSQLHHGKTLKKESHHEKSSGKRQDDFVRLYHPRL